MGCCKIKQRNITWKKQMFHKLRNTWILATFPTEIYKVINEIWKNSKCLPPHCWVPIIVDWRAACIEVTGIRWLLVLLWRAEGGSLGTAEPTLIRIPWISWSLPNKEAATSGSSNVMKANDRKGLGMKTSET